MCCEMKAAPAGAANTNEGLDDNQPREVTAVTTSSTIWQPR